MSKFTDVMFGPEPTSDGWDPPADDPELDEAIRDFARRFTVENRDLRRPTEFGFDVGEGW